MNKSLKKIKLNLMKKKNERNIFFKQCSHVIMCQDCVLNFAKKDILKKNQKKKRRRRNNK